MAEETRTNLREADNKIEVVGILAEKNLETFNDNNKEGIRGTLAIKTSEDNTVTFNVYINKMTANNTVNKAYPGVETIMEQYKSIVDVGEQEATRVKVSNGKLNPNTYFDQGGNQKSIMRYSSNFFNRLKEDEDFKAEFAVEVYIESIVREIEKEEETGRVILRGWIPTYNGIEPITLIAGEEDGIADAVESTYAPRDTVKFYGKIVSAVKIETKEIQMAIGKPKIEEHKSYVNELVITGASVALEEPQAFDPDVIAKAIVEREAKLEEAKQKAKEKAQPSHGRVGNVSGVQSSNASGRRLPNF